MIKKSSWNFSFIFVIGIFFVLTYLSENLFFRIDLTEDERYTLSDATIKILENLDETVTIKAYFTEDLPTNVNASKREFFDLVSEFDSYSGGMIAYEIINPETDEEKQKAIQEGVTPVRLDVREKDQILQKEAFLGVALYLGDKKEVIPFIQPGISMEYDLTSLIKKMTIKEKTKIGFLTGHNEATLEKIPQLNQNLSVFFDAVPIDLDDNSISLSEYKTLVIIKPLDTIPKNHVEMLKNYYNSGGNIFMALDKVGGNFQTLRGESINTGLENWLRELGIVLTDQFLISFPCASVSVQQQQGMFTMVNRVQFPFLPVVSNFGEHSISKGLGPIIFPFVSSIQIAESQNPDIQIVPFIKSSEKSGLLPSQTYFDVQKQWSNSDFTMGELNIGVVASNTKTQTKIVVISDADFIINDNELSSGGDLPEQNLNLAQNSIEWISDDSGLISLRNKGINFRPLDVVEDSTKTILKYLNFLLPIILVIIYGIVRFQINARIRLKRMTPNFI